MSRKAMLVAVLAISTGLFGQRSGAPGGTSGAGSAGTGSTGSTAGAGSGIGTSATQAGTPATQGAVGGASGQAAAGQTNTPSANTAGSPTLPAAMAGPSGTTGSTQANPDNLNNGGTFNNNGSNFNNGFVGGGVAGSGVLATPSGTFASPAPTAGISDAGRAGISANTPANTGVQSTLENSTVVYINESPINPAPVNTSSAGSSSERLIHDMGPSYFSNTVGGGSTASLGEVAARIKAAHGSANARMLTNDDVQKMVSSNSGVTVAKNMPPLGPGAAILNGTSGNTQNTMSQTAAGSGAQAASSQPSGSQMAQGTAPAGQQRTGTPPPVDATQGQPAGQSATAGNSTTPQINQNQQSNDAQGRSRLPATSTFLPLFGLLGIVSGGLGLWFRKFRR
jgi:hypothetical protein